MSALFAESRVLPKRTEAEMLDMLRTRYTRPGNGGSGEWAFVTHVRDAAGHYALRTVDALALDLYPTRGNHLHGFEVKVSRSDWLRELADPSKSAPFIARCNRWWLVAAEGVVKEGELPEGWGLLVPSGGRLRRVVNAPLLPPTPERQLVDRDWLVCLLRAAGCALGSNRAERMATSSARQSSPVAESLGFGSDTGETQ